MKTVLHPSALYIIYLQTNCSYINPERKQINRGLEGSLQKYDVVKSLKVEWREIGDEKKADAHTGMVPSVVVVVAAVLRLRVAGDPGQYGMQYLSQTAAVINLIHPSWRLRTFKSF